MFQQPTTNNQQRRWLMRTRVAAQQDVDFTAAARGATALEALAGAAKELQQHSLLDVVQPPNARRCDGERD
jgi:hypothetical protein